MQGFFAALRMTNFFFTGSNGQPQVHAMVERESMWKRISPLCRSQEARAASVEMTVAEVGRGQKVSVEIFRLERAGEWRKAETLGILRCAQDDSRDLAL